MSTLKRTTEPEHDKEAPSWSDAAKEATRQLIDDGTFVPLDGWLHLKQSR